MNTPAGEAEAKGFSGLGITATALGSLAVLVAIVPVLGRLVIPVALLGLLLGLIGLILALTGKQAGAGLPAAGLGLNAAAIAVSVLMTSFAVHQASPEVQAQRVAAAEPALNVTAGQMVGDYVANQIAADNRYQGQIVLVRGAVKSMGRDLLDTMYVTLDGGHPVRDVQCYFADDAAEALGLLRTGQVITVKGRVDGLFMNVLVKSSVLVE